MNKPIQDNKVSSFWKRLTSKDPTTIKNKRHITSIAVAMSLLAFSCASNAATDTGLYGDDKYAGKFPIGFTFNYYGQSFTDFYVTTNGLIQFSSPSSAYNNQRLPSLGNTLFVFWDDLRTDVSGQPTGTIQYEMQGVAPNRRLVIQWTNQYFYGSNLPMGTFQAVLYESSNQVKYQYRYLINERSKGNSATIGIQGQNNQIVQLGFNQPNTVAAEQAILFTPSKDNKNYTADTHADYDFIDISGLIVQRPTVDNYYTNDSITWSWPKLTKLNNYQIEIQDQTGAIVHTEKLGNVDHFTYKQKLPHGNTYQARVRGSINNGGTWEVWSYLSPTVTVDNVAPTVDLETFSRTGQNSVKITYHAADDISGVAKVTAQLSTDASFNTILLEKTVEGEGNSLTLTGDLPTGILYARLSVQDEVGNTSKFTAGKAIAVSIPSIITPVTNSVQSQKTITVRGQVETSGTVQLYLNDQAIGTPISVDESGQFSADVTFPAEGKYQLYAIAQNEQGTSPKSTVINFEVKLPIPTANFVTPADNITLVAPTPIEVSAIDEQGIDHVNIYVDNRLLSKLTQAPYQINWDVSTVRNGQHTIKAEVTNTTGKKVTLERSVTVKVEAPTPPPTPYTGKVLAISPEVTYGLQPITIKGTANYRSDHTAANNAPLKIVLTVNGFDRTINVVTDEQGNFSYTFIPQQSDGGIYKVAIIHPKETSHDEQGTFTINRIQFNYQGYNLKTARNLASVIDVTANAAAGAKNLRWVARAEDQPTGSLPQGIELDVGKGIDIAPSKTASLPISFKANDTAQPAGTIYLVALADDSGDLIRGKLQLNYQLVQANANLYASPSYIETGLQQGQSISEKFELGNNGLVEANDVKIALTTPNGQPIPSWISLNTDQQLGKIAVDDKLPLQLTIQPDEQVKDGIYNIIINVSASNASSGKIPVAVSVTQHGQGAVRFDVADIYTATLDEQGNPIKGVKNATIKLQNEAVTTQEYTIKTNNEGIAFIDKLPTGVYRYRASASDHMDASGRLVIRPNTTNNQHLFLEYQTIKIDFNVTETTIEDVYDIDIEATFNTEVPSPVLVFHPLAINLANMQLGEEKTGQLTLTNYGLTQAENVKVSLPTSDDQFNYEFFGTVPTTMEPKSQVVIPYRITALKDSKARAMLQPKIMKRTTNSDEDCSSYSKDTIATYDGRCANGDISNGSTSAKYYKVVGSCSNGGVGGNWGNNGSGGNGGNGGSDWNGGAIISPPAIPMTDACTPDADDSCDDGGNPANESTGSK